MKRVLIVDDDPMLRRGLRRMVQETVDDQNTPLHEACNGLEAIEELKKHPEDSWLVITDNDMPGMSGLELLEKLTSDLAKTKTYRVLNTASLEVSEEVARDAGADRLIRKPSPSMTYVGIVHAFLQSS